MLPVEIKEAIENIGDPVKNVSAVGGGCISETLCVELNGGRKLFAKYASTNTSMFKKEASGLKEIKKSKSINVPIIIDVGEKYLMVNFFVVKVINL